LAEATLTNPMTGIADGFARAASGHVTATLPKEQMNSRRLMAASGAQRTGIETIALRKGLAKSAMGQKQTFRFTPESGHLQCTSACPLWAKSGHQRATN